MEKIMTFDQVQAGLDGYRASLDQLRRSSDRASVRSLPEGSFFLFGMGPRRKLIYSAGVLRDALSGDVLRAWGAAQEIILPSEYRVALRTSGGDEVQLWEDEDGIWLEEGGERRQLDSGRVTLPKVYGSSLRTRPARAPPGNPGQHPRRPAAAQFVCLPPPLAA